MRNKEDILNILSTLSLLNSDSFSKLKSFYASSNTLTSNKSPLLFLIDVLKSVIGYDKLKDEILSFLSINLLTLESSIKILMRRFLKEHYSCSNDALINPDLINVGVNFYLKGIDITNLLKINPLSVEGQLLYGNIQNDLNATLYNSIQTPSTPINYKNILSVTYFNSGIVNGDLKSDVVNVKINNSYLNKKINLFINDLLDSMVLFTYHNVINKTFDVLFGSFSSFRTLDDIKKEKEIEILFNKIIDYRDDNYNNDYYSFTNTKIKDIYSSLYEKKRQVRKIVNCELVDTEVNVQDMIGINNLTPISQLVNNEGVIRTQFDIITKNIEKKSSQLNKPSNIFDFYLSFFKGLIYSVFINIFSPKFIILISLYAKLVRSNTVFTTHKDFINENIEFIKKMTYNIIMPFFINFLQSILKKYIDELLAKDKVKRIKEKFDLYQLQIRSLTNIL